MIDLSLGHIIVAVIAAIIAALPPKSMQGSPLSNVDFYPVLLLMPNASDHTSCMRLVPWGARTSPEHYSLEG